MITHLECIINEMYPGAPYYTYHICMYLATVNYTFGAAEHDDDHDRDHLSTDG